VGDCGIRAAGKMSELVKGIKTARSEARMAFGNDRIYLEKGLTNPRHVEVQVLADQHGNVVHLGTRNCSIQRRHQKMIEIAPALFPQQMLDVICGTAVRPPGHPTTSMRAPWSFSWTGKTGFIFWK